MRLWWIAALSVALAFLDIPRAAAGDTYRFASDPATGYAIEGVDPVAYFVLNEPLPGLAKFEFKWGGTTWVFLNEGNRAAFVADPAVYAPQFGGCDALALAEGYATVGNPYVFALYGNRLFLFHSEVNRFLFLSNPVALLDMAKANSNRLDCQAN